MQGRLVILVSMTTAVLGVAIGLLIGFQYQSQPDVTSRRVRTAEQEGSRQFLAVEDETITEKIIEEYQAENFGHFLHYLTTEPHMAGTSRQVELAHYIRQTWLDQGLDSVQLVPYELLLSYPDRDQPNLVHILDENGESIFSSAPYEPPLTSEENVTKMIPPYSAFSPNATVEGDLIYVNHGRNSDYDTLEELGHNATGKIVIARYGNGNRGNKVKAAEEHGAIGIILYSDPDEYAQDGGHPDNVYPNTWWLPGSGTQRGRISKTFGDAQTPERPSNSHAYRWPMSAVKDKLPQIPCQPIGYGDAIQLLSRLGGPVAPLLWQGGLNITYRIGPGFQDPDMQKSVKLEVHNYLETATAYNVVGRIMGSQEADRYVIYGNHRDAWGFGAVDPSSGTAGMLEVTRVFGKLVREDGWRPRRTMIFLSWAAEEFGNLGSFEWVEEYVRDLSHRTVAYLNLDNAMQGNYVFGGRASPSLKAVMREATKRIPDPDDPAISVYDSWLEKLPTVGGLPIIPGLGSGTDFTAFVQQVAIPCTDHTYLYNILDLLPSYPLYHSVYETMRLVEIIDPLFTHGSASALVMAEMGRDLADSVIIPYNLTEFGATVETYVSAANRSYGNELAQSGFSLDLLEEVALNFSHGITAFHERLETLDMNDPLAVRAMNDKLLLLERNFLAPRGLPDRPYEKHLLFAPSSSNSYVAASFPGLTDLVAGLPDAEVPEVQWLRIGQQLADITHSIQAAADSLKSDWVSLSRDPNPDPEDGGGGGGDEGEVTEATTPSGAAVNYCTLASLGISVLVSGLSS